MFKTENKEKIRKNIQSDKCLEDQMNNQSDKCLENQMNNQTESQTNV